MFYKTIAIYSLLLSCYPLWGQANDCYEEERVITTDWTQYNPSSNGLYPNDWDWTGVSTGYRYEMNMGSNIGGALVPQTYSIVPPFTLVCIILTLFCIIRIPLEMWISLRMLF